MATATATSHVRFSSSVDLAEDTKSKVIDICNARLADTLDLFSQVKHAHWNVKGPTFIQLHELFDSVAEHVEDFSDLIAERITQLGGVATAPSGRLPPAPRLRNTTSKP